MLNQLWKRLWQTSPELMATSGLMLIVLAGTMVGLAVDPRIITGAPAWLKPAKFAVSIALYSATLAWFFTFIPEWTRTRRLIGWGTALAMVVEMAIIGSQAWRGTTSHFNVSTPYDAWLFRIMGLAIVAQTLSSIAVAVALWRQRFDDLSIGWAMRWGMTLTIMGALTGGLMARPTTAQLTAARATGHLAVAGSHTVGAPDGGTGLPGTGWSAEHGDLRIPHFIGLHAMQALPVIALLLTRRRLHQQVRTQLTLIASASYAALFVILVIEALRGVPLLAPDATTSTQLALWLAATLSATTIALMGHAHAMRRAAVLS